MLRCRDIVDLLGEYLDGALDPDTLRALEAHLAGCQDCTAFINTYRGTAQSSRTLSEGELPLELQERLLTFLRQQTRP